MTTAIQFRRGSTNDHKLFTGLEGEITVDTTKKTAVVHDNITAGGFSLAREDLKNVSTDTVANKGIAKSNMENVSCDDIANRGIAKQDLSNIATETIAAKGIMKTDCSNATILASETEIGPTQFATEEEASDTTLTTKALNPKQATHLIKSYSHLPKDYISGFKITRIDDKQLQIDTGEARCADNKYDIILTEPIIKNINSTWEPGTNFGGLEKNVTIKASTSYFIFAIITKDGLIDIIISDSDIDLSTSIASEFGYVAYRKIGMIVTNTDMGINERYTIDGTDRNSINVLEKIAFTPSSTTSYTVPFNGTAFYCSGLRNGNITELSLNNKIIATFEGTTSGFTRTTVSFNVKKNDVVGLYAINNTNRNSALHIYKERNLNNV